MEDIECRMCGSKVRAVNCGHDGVYLACDCDTHVGKQKLLANQLDETFWVKESEELEDDLKEIVEYD